MLSSSVRVWVCLGFLPLVFRRVCECVMWLRSFACTLQALELWRHLRGWAVAYLLPVSLLLRPQRALQSSPLHTYFLPSKLFFPPSAPTKVLMIPGPGNPRGCKPPGESQTTRWSGSALCKPEPWMDGAPPPPPKNALSLPKQPVQVCSLAVPGSLL